MTGLNGASTFGISSGIDTVRSVGGLDPRNDGLTRRQQSFSAVLGKAARDPTRSPADEARETAERFVADALIFPLLKQFREQNHAAAPFAPTSGEKQFQSIADAETARHIAGASNFPLVDRIAADLLRMHEARTGGSGGVDDAA